MPRGRALAARAGIVAADGVVLAAVPAAPPRGVATATPAAIEGDVRGPDAPPQLERLHAIDDHVACVVAGVLPDALALVARARAAARAHRAAWGEPIPVALLARRCATCPRPQRRRRACARSAPRSSSPAGTPRAATSSTARSPPARARYRAAVIGGNARSSRRLERALLPAVPRRNRRRRRRGRRRGHADDVLVDADGDAAPLLDATSQAARLLYELPQRVRARGPTPGSGAAAVRVEPLEMLLVSHRAGRTFVHFVDPEIALQLRTARKPAAGSAAAVVDPS